jgi:hypothetical protein
MGKIIMGLVVYECLRAIFLNAVGKYNNRER